MAKVEGVLCILLRHVGLLYVICGSSKRAMPKLFVHDMEHIAVCTSCMHIYIYVCMKPYIYVYIYGPV